MFACVDDIEKQPKVKHKVHLQWLFKKKSKVNNEPYNWSFLMFEDHL